jgi:hypothetical protein
MARRRSIRSRLRRFVEIGWRRRALLAEAAVLLLLARVALRIVPFQRLARRLGSVVVPADPRVRQAQAQSAAADVAVAREIGWAVTRA